MKKSGMPRMVGMRKTNPFGPTKQTGAMKRTSNFLKTPRPIKKPK
jgi:hypothetical protein